MNVKFCILKKLILFITIFKKYVFCAEYIPIHKRYQTFIDLDCKDMNILPKKHSSSLNKSGNSKNTSANCNFEIEKKNEIMKRKREKEEKIKLRCQKEAKRRQELEKEEKRKQEIEKEEQRKRELEKMEEERKMELKILKERNRDWPKFYKKKSILNEIVAHNITLKQMRRTTVSIRRKYLLFDSYDKLAHLPPDYIPHQHISIALEGEIGSDFTGLTREWLRLFVNYMLDEKLNLFTVVNQKEGTYLPSNTKEKIKYVNFDIYRFIGRVLGYIIMLDQPTSVRFHEIFFERVFDLKYKMEDLYDVDPELTKSLKSLQDNPVDGLFFENKYGEELISNGSNCPVTKENAAEYCDLYLENIYCERVAPAYDLIKRGLFESLPTKMHCFFNPWECDFLVSGSKELDVNVWKKNTHYKKGYSINSEVIIWFWNYIDKIDKKQKQRLFEIITSYSHVPFFKILKDENYTQIGKFKNCDDFELMIISRQENCNRCPVAHTCTRTLELPNYDSKEKLEKYLDFFASPEAEKFHLA